jgi:hypothetical protein
MKSDDRMKKPRKLQKEKTKTMASTSIVIVIVIALFALVVVSGFLVFRKRGRVKMNAPLGMKLDFDANNETPEKKPAIKISDAESTGGGILAEDNQGGGVEINKVKVADDIIATSSKKK